MASCEAERKDRQQGGFTYLGLLLLLSLFALASSLTLEVAELSARRESEAELLAMGQAFNKAFKSYYMQTPVGTRRYPGTLEELTKDPRYPGVKRHLRRVYIDPLTGNADWGLINAPEGGIMGVYSKAEGKPIHEKHFSPLVPSVPATPAAPQPMQPVPMVQTAASDPSAALQPPGSPAQSYREWQFGYAPDALNTAPMRRSGSAQYAPTP